MTAPDLPAPFLFPFSASALSNRVWGKNILGEPPRTLPPGTKSVQPGDKPTPAVDAVVDEEELANASAEVEESRREEVEGAEEVGKEEEGGV